jgi:hypothetical protein
MYNEKEANSNEALAKIKVLKDHLEAQDGFRAADQKISIVVKKFKMAQDALKAAKKATENLRDELNTIQGEIENKRFSMKRHIQNADDMIRAIGQTGTALISKDSGASLPMEWADDVLEAAADAEQSKEEDGGGLVRTRSTAFLDEE